KRIAEIDAQFKSRAKPQTKKDQKTARTKSKQRPGSKDAVTPDPVEPESTADWKNLPEETRAALLRGELETAGRKINFRDQWNRAKTDAERARIKSEISRGQSDLSAWAQVSLSKPEEDAAANLDSSKVPNIKDATTTGETLFPKETFSYAMAPNFAETVKRL